MALFMISKKVCSVVDGFIRNQPSARMLHRWTAFSILGERIFEYIYPPVGGTEEGGERRGYPNASRGF